MAEFDLHVGVVLEAPPEPSFLLTANPPGGTIPRGVVFAFAITASSLEGYTGPIFLTVTSVPATAIVQLSASVMAIDDVVTMTVENVGGLGEATEVVVHGASVPA